ncbi:MAG: right-handed parallel beta-helix repeat-containing protein [Candidatus Thorarchaeota archaeon]
MTAKSDKSLLVVNGAITASTTGDIYSGSGNWVINQSTTYIDEVLTVYGNISINFPGSLTLVNTTINFEPPNDVAYFKANPDTSLYIVRSHLYSSSKTFEISFRSRSEGNISYSYIENFRIVGIGSTVSGGDYNTVIYGNVFRNCTGDDAAIGATYGLFGDVNISSNEFYDWDATDTTGPKNVIRIGFGDCYKTVIYNNTIHDLSVGQNNFWSGYIAIGYQSTQTKIIDNTFYNLGNPSSRASPVIVTKGKQSTITGNTLRDSWAMGIDLTENDTVISGNRFTNLSGIYHDLLGDHSVPAIFARTFHPYSDTWDHSANLTVESNVFTYNMGPSIWCNGTHTYNVTIENNIIGNSESVTESAIILSGGVHNVTLTGNLLAGNWIGLNITGDATNQTIINNAFLWNTYQAIDFNHTNKMSGLIPRTVISGRATTALTLTIIGLEIQHSM